MSTEPTGNVRHFPWTAEDGLVICGSIIEDMAEGLAAEAPAVAKALASIKESTA
jgi:hypothetical protein